MLSQTQNPLHLSLSKPSSRFSPFFYQPFSRISMAASLNTGVAPSCFFRTNKLALKPRPVRCTRKHESSDSFTSEPSQQELNGQSLDMLQESLVSTSNSRSDKNSDIWKIFNDAQRNILYLNKRRIAAIEELKKCQTENALLLARIKELEAGTKASGVKGSIAKLDYLSIKCDLLLRIDSMVLSGLIGAVESSDLRRLVTHSSYSLLDALCDIQQKKDLELLISLRQYSDESKRKGLHVVHICSEMAPVASHGSLASYVTGLSRAVQRKGNLVEVILPKYSTLALDEVWGLRKIEAEFLSYFDGDWHANRIWTGVVYGIGVTFIEPVYYSSYFNRERICGYLDDFERFTYFSRASLDYLVKAGKRPDVLHIHNWETAIVGPLFWDIFVNQGLGGTRILITCHGFNSQCLENPEKLALCGLDPPRLHRPDRLQDNIKTHLVNILKGGVVYSNKVVVISSIHSKDKIIHTLSRGLESTLAIHKEKLVVAPYGFDDTIWDPSKDNLLPTKYSVDNIRGKAICKTVLRQHLGLYGEASTVIVGSIYSELPDVDLENLKAAVSVALSKGAQLVFMDTSKIQSLHAALEPCEDFKDENVRFLNKDDKDSLHLLFAGSDIILCPSFHDPVQQVPLKALKYGAAPIAITFNNNGFSRPEENHFGSTNLSYYIISTYTNMSLSQALDQIKNDPSGWNKRMKEGMAKDFSWDSECCDIHSAAYMSIKN